MTKPMVDATKDAERPLTPDELLLGQLAQTLLATRAQAYATMEQCDAALMVVAALQQREAQRAVIARPIEPTERPIPKTFGAAREKKEARS